MKIILFLLVSALAFSDSGSYKWNKDINYLVDNCTGVVGAQVVSWTKDTPYVDKSDREFASKMPAWQTISGMMDAFKYYNVFAERKSLSLPQLIEVVKEPDTVVVVVLKTGPSEGHVVILTGYSEGYFRVQDAGNWFPKKMDEAGLYYARLYDFSIVIKKNPPVIVSSNRFDKIRAYPDGRWRFFSDADIIGYEQLCKRMGWPNPFPY